MSWRFITLSENNSSFVFLFKMLTNARLGSMTAIRMQTVQTLMILTTVHVRKDIKEMVLTAQVNILTYLLLLLTSSIETR